jgi:sec-independent protein translocase protein TatA
MGRLGLPELLVIFVILVLLFGAAKIPMLGKGLGEGIRNFRKGLRGGGGDGGEEGPGRTPPQEPR